MDLGSGIWKKPIVDPESRGQKGTDPRSRIRNTGSQTPGPFSAIDKISKLCCQLGGQVQDKYKVPFSTITVKISLLPAGWTDPSPWEPGEPFQQ
jgi:hypothetical protein